MANDVAINLFPSKIEDASEKDKGGWALFGDPGKHLLVDLESLVAGATPYRGSICVNGRFFVAAGVHFFEVNSAMALVGSVYTITLGVGDPTVQMFTNGSPGQIMIIAGGLCHIFDGFSMNVIRLPILRGTIFTNGLACTYGSGDKFDPSMAGQAIVISGLGYTVDQITGPDSLTLTGTAVPARHDVSAATNANPVVITCAGHGLTTGDNVLFVGATGLWEPLNDTVFVATVIGANTFSVPLDSTAFGALTGTIQFAVSWSTSARNMRVVSGFVLDGYFGVAREDSTQVNLSPLLDGTNNGTYIWDQNDSQQRETGPGYLTGTITLAEQLYVMAVDGFDVWAPLANPGAVTFPFQRINGAGSNIGNLSRWGPLVIEDKIYFIGGRAGALSAYELDGFTPVRISTHAMEFALNAQSLGPNCVSYTESYEGNTFWVINFGAQTWVYDIRVKLWHQRYRWNGSSFTDYLTKYHTYAQNSHGSANDWGANGKHIVGGDGTGKIFEASLNFYDDAGADIKVEKRTPYMWASGGKRLYFGEMVLECETGTVPSGTLLVVRDRSDDQGFTFTFPESVSMGASGSHTARVYWASGGSVRGGGRIWRFSITGQSKIALIALDCDVTQGET